MNIDENLKGGEIYDSIATDYAAIKTNVFKVKYEEPAFWEGLGDITGKDVLDLACGSGHYTRTMKKKGAHYVVGVDISEQMVLEAKREEDKNGGKSLEIEYYQGDATAYSYKHDQFFDVVTAQYLLCYADSMEKLKLFCSTAFKNVKHGGKFLAITTVLDETCKQRDFPFGIRYDPIDKVQPGEEWHDGIQIQITVLSEDKKSKCSFPNYLWRFSTIQSELLQVGFDAVEKHVPLESVPVIQITARKY